MPDNRFSPEEDGFEEYDEEEYEEWLNLYQEDEDDWLEEDDFDELDFNE